MFVEDVMTPSPVWCRPDDDLERVAALMVERDCGAVPVCADGQVIGMITDRDITCRVVATGKSPRRLSASDVMTAPVHTVQQNADIEIAIGLMKTHQVRRLPVLDANGKLAGILSPSDLAPLFASTDVADFLLAVSYWTRRPAEFEVAGKPA